VVDAVGARDDGGARTHVRQVSQSWVTVPSAPAVDYNGERAGAHDGLPFAHCGVGVTGVAFGEGAFAACGQRATRQVSIGNFGVSESLDLAVG